MCGMSILSGDGDPVDETAHKSSYARFHLSSQATRPTLPCIHGLVELVGLVWLVWLHRSRYCPVVPATFTTEDAKALLAQARTAAAVDAAKTAVLGALQHAAAAHELSEADAADYAASINSFRDAFALDQWLFTQPPMLSRRICNYPLCFNTPRPAPESRAGGNPPLYCEGSNESRQPHAISQNARRRRDKLKEVAGLSGAGGTGLAVPAAASGPVTEARSTFVSGVDLVVAGVHDLVDKVDQLREVAARGRDDALVQAEIDAVRHKANEDVERERAARSAFEQRALAAEAACALSNAEKAELVAANQQLEEQADADAITHLSLLHAFLSALHATRADAERQIADARQEAQLHVDRAQAEFEQELARREEEMATAVNAANAARDTALEQAADREREAGLTVTRAEENLAEEKQRAEGLVADNTRLRDAAIVREREVQTMMNDLSAGHQRAVEELQAAISMLRERLETSHTDAERALAEQRAEFRSELAKRLAETTAAADKLKQAEHAALVAQVESLTLQLQARESPEQRDATGE